MVLKEVKTVLFLLFVVASAGLLMRSWDWAINLGVDYYNLRQAHSHLAFLGWVFPAIMILYNPLFTKSPDEPVDKFLFWVLILINVFMFGSFLVFGYTGPSIILLSVHTALAFTYAWRFLSRLSEKVIGGSRLLLVSSIMAMCVSFLGPLAIPVIKNTGGGPDQMKLAIHFYLHFQYNVFFVLAILALAARKSEPIDLKTPAILTIFGMCGSYFVTVSWGIESEILKGIGSIAAGIQFIGIVWLLYLLRNSKKPDSARSHWILKLLMFTVVGSLIVKCCLQAGSHWFPQLSIEGGVHVWVIAFLHLIFIGAVTPYILFEFINLKMMPSSKLNLSAIALLLVGVVVTESVLALQGIALYFPSVSFDFFPVVLQLGSLFLWIAIGGLVLSSFRATSN